MYNTKFILSNGIELYPGYLTKEERERIREQYKDSREFMRCGCRPDSNLYYRISEDLKIYPEHNNYRHDRYCSRYRDAEGNAERQTAYLINDEDGGVTAFLTFNPRNFNIDDDEDETVTAGEDVSEEENEDTETVVIEKRETDKTAVKKEPKLTLADLIRSVNVDSFTERVLHNRLIDNRELFSNLVFRRMAKVRLSRMQKSVGGLTLADDGVRFVYLKYSEAYAVTENGYTRCYVETVDGDGVIYKNLILPETLAKAVKEFSKNYGTEPDDNTIISGFQYLRKSRTGKSFRILGRVNIFQISDIGIYSRSLVEMKTYNRLTAIVKEHPDIRFYIPPEDVDVGAIVEIKGFSRRILMMFKQRKKECFTYNSSLYELVVVDDATIVTRDWLYGLLEGGSEMEAE